MPNTVSCPASLLARPRDNITQANFCKCPLPTIMKNVALSTLLKHPPGRLLRFILYTYLIWSSYISRKDNSTGGTVEYLLARYLCLFVCVGLSCTSSFWIFKFKSSWCFSIRHYLEKTPPSATAATAFWRVFLLFFHQRYNTYLLMLAQEATPVLLFVGTDNIHIQTLQILSDHLAKCNY